MIYKATYNIPDLPIKDDEYKPEIETKRVLKALTESRSALAELKGVCGTIPNKNILIDTLSLQEAKASSEIESIITTHDDLYKSNYEAGFFQTLESKEVSLYSEALKKRYALIRNSGLLGGRNILEIQEILIRNNAGFRKQEGTTIKNENTGEIIYVPPQSHDDILKHMRNLENYINDDDLCLFDPLVKMAIIHHQFESIHPFYDGNGRTGRIINILYLVKNNLLDSPILYLSRYINKNKSEYYRLLQDVRDYQKWEDWILFMLKGVQETSLQTIKTIQSIKKLMDEYKKMIKQKNEKIYSHDLLNNIFRHPYTKIEFVTNDLNIGRQTATKYLNILVDIGILEKLKYGKENYYINTKLFDLLTDVNSK